MIRTGSGWAGAGTAVVGDLRSPQDIQERPDIPTTSLSRRVFQSSLKLYETEFTDVLVAAVGDPEFFGAPGGREQS
jgi:hypothetical protein